MTGMASRSTMRLLRAPQYLAPIRSSCKQRCQVPRFYSTQVEEIDPPYIAKVKGELKAAMRAKDMPRLAVLRAIIGLNIDANKKNQPLKNDVNLVRAMARMRSVAEKSAEEAKAAGRDDLVAKALREAELISEYEKGSGVEFVDAESMRPFIIEEIERTVKGRDESKSFVSDVIHQVRQAYLGKNFDNKAMSQIVIEETKSRKQALKAKMNS